MRGLWNVSLSLLVAQATVVAAECELTTPMPQGSHHKAGADFRVNVGQGLTVSGRVLSVKDCSPIAGAKIDPWQANSDGYYQDSLRAHLFSGEDGSYRFETEWPGTSIPHIHFIVSAEGFGTLTTQWVGNDAKSNLEVDFVLQLSQGN